MESPSDRSVSSGASAPETTFLKALVAALGAGRAAVLRLDPSEGSWGLEREVRSDGWRSLRDVRWPADGHPLTWCLKEELVVQVESTELLGDAVQPGWTVAGALPGSAAIVLASFSGSPPPAARETLPLAAAHLADLEALRRPEGKGSPGG